MVVTTNSVARAGVRRSSARRRRGARDAGVARGDTTLLHHAQRSMSFSIIYMVMNVGYLVAG